MKILSIFFSSWMSRTQTSTRNDWRCHSFTNLLCINIEVWCGHGPVLILRRIYECESRIYLHNYRTNIGKNCTHLMNMKYSTRTKYQVGNEENWAVLILRLPSRAVYHYHGNSVVHVPYCLQGFECERRLQLRLLYYKRN